MFNVAENVTLGDLECRINRLRDLPVTNKTQSNIIGTSSEKDQVSTLMDKVSIFSLITF